MTQDSSLPGSQAQSLLEHLSNWSNTTTIVLHLGCVFEFKGPFPKGSLAHGYYNLSGPVPGFHGHINLDLIDHIGFQDKLHGGRESYAFCFNNADGDNLFKVFLGRDNEGNLLNEQVTEFIQIRNRLRV